MLELELAEREAFRGFYSLSPGEVHELGGAAAALRIPGTTVRWVNRVVGLGLEQPASDSDLDAIVEAYGGAEHSVGVSPHARPADLADRLMARGYEPGYAWMKFGRGVDPAPRAETDLVVEDTRDGDAFAAVVTQAYGFPRPIAEMVAQIPGRSGWHCFLARDGQRPVAGGALFVCGRTGWLGFAGTLPEARGRGGQGAILAARIEAARAAGCTALTTETGVIEAGRPSNSYRNILRSGFREAGARPNYDST